MFESHYKQFRHSVYMLLLHNVLFKYWLIKIFYFLHYVLLSFIKVLFDLDKLYTVWLPNCFIYLYIFYALIQNVTVIMLLVMFSFFINDYLRSWHCERLQLRICDCLPSWPPHQHTAYRVYIKASIRKTFHILSLGKYNFTNLLKFSMSYCGNGSSSSSFKS